MWHPRVGAARDLKSFDFNVTADETGLKVDRALDTRTDARGIAVSDVAHVRGHATVKPVVAAAVAGSPVVSCHVGDARFLNRFS